MQSIANQLRWATQSTIDTIRPQSSSRPEGEMQSMSHRPVTEKAAINLRNLAILALPVANRTVTNGTASAHCAGTGGKVTPVRHECVHQAPSGQEMDCAYI